MPSDPRAGRSSRSRRRTATPRRRAGRRPLREDGPQRDRVRADGGVRRGLRADDHSEFDLDLDQIAGIWRYGSVVRSWLLDLLYEAFKEHGSTSRRSRLRRGLGRGPLDDQRGDRRERPGPGDRRALFARFASRREINFAAKVHAALRNQFGGHAVRAAEARGEDPDPASLRTRCSKGSSSGARRTRACSSSSARRAT